MKHLCILILLSALIIVNTKAQNSAINKNKANSSKNITSNISVLEDSNGSFILKNIIDSKQHQLFKETDSDVLNFGFSKSVYWLKIETNNFNNIKNNILVIKDARIDSIVCFQLNKDNEIIKQEITGFKIPISEKSYYNHYQLFAINPDAKVVYLRFKNNSVPISVYLYDQVEFQKEYVMNIIIFCFLIGFTLFVIANNFLHFLLSGEKTSLHYFLLVTFILLALIAPFGLHTYFYEPIGLYTLSFLNIVSLILTILIVTYCIHFLELNIKNNYYHMAIISYLIFSVFFALITEEMVAFNLMQTNALIALIFAMFNGWNTYNKFRTQHSFIYALSYSLFFIFILLEVFHNLSGTSYFFVLSYLEMGIFCEISGLAYALTLKMENSKITLQKEKEKAKEELLVKVQENKKILQEQNQKLEQGVKERTEELQVLNEELNSTVEELGLTLENLELQRKTVETINRKITASINYAQTIQQAVLPDKLILESYLQDYFLLYRPKDIVSGDFYWVAPIPKGYVVAVADCTGHGVAGSFMSLVGINLLGKMEDELETLSPSEMIRRLNIGVDKALKQDERQSYNEGMDIGIVRVEKEGNNYTLTFAGAKRPLYYISKEERKLQEIAGDRFSVGIGTQREIFIQNHTLTLKTGDSFYLLSDGLADQNNEKRKRLGENILKETLQNLFDQESNTQLQQLEKLLDKHQGTAEQRDDITLLSVKLI